MVIKENITKIVTARAISLREITLFFVSFFLIVTLLTLFVIIPKFNQTLEQQHEQDLQVELALEVELFQRFVETKKRVLEDLAGFSSLTNAVMLSDASNPQVIDLLENTLIGGEKGKLVLQDISGNVLLQSTDALEGSYTENDDWITAILSGEKPYHFQLLGQEGDLLTFKISVPVLYNTHIEGALSAEMRISLKELFVTQSFNKHIAFKLKQGDVTVQTDFTHIDIAHDVSVRLPELELLFTYTSDHVAIIEKERQLRNAILSVLLAGLIISFIVFAALAYRNFTRAEKAANVKLSSRMRYIVPILVALMGSAASVAAYLMILNLQEASKQEEFFADSRKDIQSVREKIASAMQTLVALKGFYDASSFVDREEFAQFVEPLLIGHADIQALEWVPSVPHAERAAYEQRAREEGIINFTFTDKNAAGEIVPAGKHDHYYPIYYVEPLESNKIVLGLAPSYSPARRAAIHKARDTGNIVAAPPIRLLQETGDQAGYLFFAPIYHGARAYLNAEARQKHIHGYVLLVLRAKDMLQQALGNISNRFVHVQDVSDPTNPETIFGEAFADETFTYAETINIAGRQWSITTAASAEEVSLYSLPMFALICGLLFTTIITFGLAHLIRRRAVVEAIVKQRTEELSESKAFLDLINANNPDLIFVKDEAFKIIQANEAFISVYPEHMRDKVIGYTTLEEYSEEGRKEFLREDKKAFAQGYSETIEKVLFPDGKERTLFTKKIRFENIDGERFILGIARDVTQREALIEKLTDSNEELERFAFVCSHDLQEPLRMIKSFSELLKKHLSDSLKDDEKGKKYFKFIMDGAERSQALINDILTYSSINSDVQKLEKVNLNSLVDAIENTMTVSLDENGGTITSDDLPELMGNKTQLFQLFQNLINNGMKYCKPDIAPHIHVGVEDSGVFWTFTISDNGIGMEEQHLQKIFDVFQRLHRNSEYAGTGVGLSICKKVAERHGGTIWVESEKGVGSRFHFTLLKPDYLENE